MEVTTVSPSPASPTEGDDLCETDVTSVAIHSVTLLICICGLAGNGAVIGLLSLKARNVGFFDLAVIDFLFFLFAVPSALLILMEDISCSPILPLMYMNFVFQLSVVSYYWALLWLMPRRPVVYMDKLCKFCCRCNLLLRLRWVVGSVQYWAFFALFAVIPTVTFLCPSDEQELCRAALISILCNFLQHLSYIVVSSEVFFLLACIHSSIKPFIYFLGRDNDPAGKRNKKWYKSLRREKAMEVTTVSPSPASPTEGDDLCETDVTRVAIHSVTLLIFCGLAGNGAVIGLLSLKTRNSGIFGFAVIDFLYLLFAVPSALLLLVEDVSCSPILPLTYLSVLFIISAISYYIGLLWLIVNSTMLYMCKICWLCCRRELPECPRRADQWAFGLLIIVIFMVTSLCPLLQEHCRVPLISMDTIVLLLFVAPVVISGTIDFIKAKWGSQQQQPKRHDIAFLVALFILFLSLCNFLQQLGYMDVSSQVVFLLACIHSSIKPFIYFLVGRCWRPCSMGSLRLSLQRVFEEPRENTAHHNDPAMDTVL
ncbi:LOW QUALITY PROTEIN: uncharacterized protein RBU47_003578 [Passerculus sandwichensis]